MSRVTDLAEEIAPGSPRGGHWTDPGAHPVAPGVFRVPLPLPNDGLRAVNVYLMVGDDGVDMIDAGWHRGDARQRLEEALREVGAQLGDVRHVLVTHLHHDHYGQAPLIRQEAGAAVLLGAGERASLEIIIDVPGGPRANWLRTLAACGAEPLIAELRSLGLENVADGDRWEYPDTWIEDDVTIDLPGRQLRAIATPGHTAGHVSFMDEATGLFFAGDHVLPHITPSIGLEVSGPRLALQEFLRSLARVRDLPVTQVLPAHGEPFTDLAARVDALTDHHRARLDAAAAAVGGGASTAYEVAEVLPWTRRELRFPTLDFFNRQLAVRESLAHLELLAAEGRLRRTDVDGVRTFAAITGA